MLTQPLTHNHPPASRISGWQVTVWLVLPWIAPWAPGPQANTVPLLIGWGSFALLLTLGRWPSALALAQAWAYAALVSSAIGLLQYFGEAPLLAGWVYVPAHVGEAMGNLRQRNQLATLTCMGAVAVLYWHTQGLRTASAAAMVALLALGNAATVSRTGLLQWLLLPLLPALWRALATVRRPVWSWPVLLWGLAVYVLGSTALPHALAVWSGVDISSAWARMRESGGCSSRAVLWGNVLHLIGQQPWTGWGWGELKYAHYMASYSGPRFCEIMGHAHNLPLHIAFAFGVPAALLAMGGVLVLVLRAQPWRLSRADSALAWGVLLPIGLHSLLEYPLWYGPFQLAMVFCIVLLWPAGDTWLAHHRRELRVLGLCGLCLIALMAWDYQRVRQVYLPVPQRSALWRDDPWGAARQTWFFGDVAQFAELTSTPVRADNAQAMLDSSLAVLHDSPEPRVIEQLIQSARLLGMDSLADWHQAQKQAVYGASAR